MSRWAKEWSITYGSPGNLRVVDPCLDKEASVAGARRYIGNLRIAAMQHLLAVAAHLGLVPVLLAVEVAVEIVAVLAPRHGGHHGDMVAMLAPAANARGHGGVDPVDHRRIRRKV